MQECVGEMEAELVRIPKEVIKNVRDILDRSVMRRERIQKQIMSERFGNKDRTLNEWIVVREILVVPDALTLQSGHRGCAFQPGVTFLKA